MNINDNVLSVTERLTFSLRGLYSKYGYQPYRMSKFEEYDLYSRNKDFLISDSVITFTDIGGKLMALKPDVTLSIIKNHTDGETKKLYYNENVYRVAKGTNTFKEIMQSGVECIGGGESEPAQLRLCAGCLEHGYPQRRIGAYHGQPRDPRRAGEMRRREEYARDPGDL